MAMAEVLPFRHEEAEDRTAFLGMVIFLGSWAMMFGAIFFAYGMVRLRAPAWPPPGVPAFPVLLPLLNTFVLAASSVTLQRGLTRMRGGKAGELRWWLLATIGLGLVFLALQAVVWLTLWRRGLRLSGGLEGGVLYGLTVFHALHVLSGLGILGWLLTGALRNAYSVKRFTPVRLTAMFWHFVDVVWVLMFLTVYLV